MNKHINQSLFLVFALLLPIFAYAEDLAIATLFARQSVEGAVVISSLNSGQTFIHNDARAKRRFSPASTFKIMNTLIAVEEKASAGKDDVFKWDGHVYDLPDWNHDQTLAGAFKASCVWCYQVLAGRIGAEKYRRYLTQADYGELQGDFDTTGFWLDGAFQVSALEQVDFLKKVVLHQLPFGNKAYKTLREIMLAEKTPTYSLWAKTGWATKTKPQVGWYVGYLETPTDVWLFALNIDARAVKDLPLRQALLRAALQVKGIIE